MFLGELWAFLSFDCCTVFVFSFLEWESIPSLAPVRFVVFRRGASHQFYTISQPPLGYVQQNTAFSFFVSRAMCVSLGFLWGAQRAPRPLEYMVLLLGNV